MELLFSPRMEYLLDASLETLHSESLEWLKEIGFWQDEMAFFYKLLHKKESKESFPSEELAALEKKLVGITGDKLDKTMNEVQNHERFLASLMRTTSFHEEENYRQAHRRLLQDIYDIHALIRDFKKDVFVFVQQYQP